MAGTTRRGFLAGLGAGGALAALARLPALPASAQPAPGTTSPDFFAPREREVLLAVVERMVDTGEPGAPAVRDTDAIAVIDAACAGLDPALTQPLPTLLRLVEWGPLLFELRLTRFSQLAPEARDASLRGWMDSRFALRRQGFQALRNLAFLGYWSQPQTWPLLGYRGPLLPSAGRAP